MTDPRLSALLEPMAITGASDSETERMLCSIAISMKRIADCLSGDEHNIGIRHALIAIAERQR